MQNVLLLIALGLLGLGFVVLMARSARDRRYGALVTWVRREYKPLFCAMPYNGRYQIVTPDTLAHGQPDYRQNFVIAVFSDGLILFDADKNAQPHRLPFDALQWVSPVDASSDPAARVTLHFEIGGHWQILDFHAVQRDMDALITALNDEGVLLRLDQGGIPFEPVGPLPARRAEQDLQGLWTLGDPVKLYLLPHLLLVLQDSHVQERIETEAIRRVLALEQIEGDTARSLLDWLNPPETGVLRLHQETARHDFVLRDYRPFAGQVAQAARAPVEIVSGKKKAT